MFTKKYFELKFFHFYLVVCDVKTAYVSPFVQQLTNTSSQQANERYSCVFFIFSGVTILYLSTFAPTCKFTFCSPNGGGVPITHCRIIKFKPTNPYPIFIRVFIYLSVH